jgi:hypothetical protein
VIAEAPPIGEVLCSHGLLCADYILFMAPIWLWGPKLHIGGGSAPRFGRRRHISIILCSRVPKNRRRRAREQWWWHSLPHRLCNLGGVLSNDPRHLCRINPRFLHDVVKAPFELGELLLLAQPQVLCHLRRISSGHCEEVQGGLVLQDLGLLFIRRRHISCR